MNYHAIVAKYSLKFFNINMFQIMKDKDGVQAQLEQYKLERRLKFEAKKTAEEELRRKWEEAELTAAREESEKREIWRSNTARLQFRLSDGSSETQHFSSDTSLAELYEFVRIGLRRQLHSSFSLSVVNPRIDLDSENMKTSLRELGLTSATVLVLPTTSSTSGEDGGLWSLIYMMMIPLKVMWSMFHSIYRAINSYQDTSHDPVTVAVEERKRRIYIGPERRRKPGFMEKLAFFICLIILLLMTLLVIDFFGITKRQWVY